MTLRLSSGGRRSLGGKNGHALDMRMKHARKNFTQQL